MRVYDMVVSERRHAADLLGTLTPDQLRTPSLCAGWTVHDVAAHLTTYLRFGQLKIYTGILLTAADLDRVNRWLTRRAARRPDAELATLLRRRAGARTTVPRSGFDPILADLVLHDLDIRVPLGIPRAIPRQALAVTFHHLTSRAAPGFAMGSRLDGLACTATDTGWTAGTGLPVEGPAETLVLGIGGRTAALDGLTGDGVPVLRQRLAATTRPGPLRRLRAPFSLVIRPQPADRRGRDAVAPLS
ncbi:MAG: maleylpyruvate isomerase family mycothiol-dependent enzyme [Actinobacteria bacterium]|nr:maleylpyruvate isomerase family mycothiol-dependent enzyme [Actinomycetota bacterium]